MKRMVLCAASALALITGLTVTPAYGEPSYKPNAICVYSHSLSIDIMGYRQNGVPIDVPKALVKSDVAIAIIDAAYSEPVLVNMVEKSDRIRTFADEMFKMCDDVLGSANKDVAMLK